MLSAPLAAALRARLPANDDPARPLMQLATVDSSGSPDLRSVLLTAWDDQGFLFNTDALSRKVAEIGGRADVALCLVIGGGQIVVRGVAVPQSPEEQRSAYAARSPYLRQLAWLNTEPMAAADAAERHRVWSEFAAAHDPLALEPSPTWLGFRVRPDVVTVWTADPDGPSHRVEYTRNVTDWTAVDLPG